MTVTREAGFAWMDEVPMPGVTQQTVGDIAAAADAFGPGVLLVPMYQPQITDMVARRGVLGQRVKHEPATGQPSRYFEQTRIIIGAFQDPRSMGFAPTQDPTRRERYLNIKAIVGSAQFGLFDVEMTRQQGQYANLVSKDITDMVDGTLRTSDLALWAGTDTNLVFPTTNQYVGLLTQINRTASIASTVRIIDGLKAEIASIIANPFYTVMPTAVYVNPVLGDLIDQEERLNQRQIPQVPLNLATGGLVVNGLATQAGHIPIIPEKFLLNGATGGSLTEAGKTDYKAVILTESLVEMHYVTTPEPRVFQLGLEGNLGTRFMSVLFSAPVAKGNANASQPQNIVETGLVTYAHSVVTVTR
jgi:hypothetical protein